MSTISLLFWKDIGHFLQDVQIKLYASDNTDSLCEGRYLIRDTQKCNITILSCLLRFMLQVLSANYGVVPGSLNPCLFP